MSDCIFCKIVDREIPANVVYEDDSIMCFHDVSPQAPVHVLLIPKKHIESMDRLLDEDKDLMGHMLLKIKEITELLGLKNGYRVVNNCGSDGMQQVMHFHFHILGKRKMIWPPG